MYKQSKLLKKIMKCYIGSFINGNNELILDNKANVFFRLEDIKSDLILKCKLIEFGSRGACKTEPYKVRHLNLTFQKRHRDNLNKILETNFSEEDMKQIYTRLGNGVNRQLTIEFIESGFEMEVLSYEQV